MSERAHASTPRPDDYLLPAGNRGLPASVLGLGEQLSSLEIRDLLSRRPELPGESREPLSVHEHLQVLALSEAIARRARQFRGVEIDKARRAGALWWQIAAAVGTSEAEVRDVYGRWVEGQRHLFVSDVAEGRQHRFGLDDVEYTAALQRLAVDTPEERS